MKTRRNYEADARVRDVCYRSVREILPRDARAPRIPRLARTRARSCARRSSLAQLSQCFPVRWPIEHWATRCWSATTTSKRAAAVPPAELSAAKRPKPSPLAWSLSPLEHTLPPVDSSEPICLICRGLLISKCALCASAPLTPHDQAAAAERGACVLAFGACGCVYHEHCLAPWLAKSAVCPYDERPWQPAAPSICAGLTGGGRARGGRRWASGNA